MPELWAIALYDCRLSSEQFYGLTPRQFALLNDRHREALLHREMVSGQITAAVINYGFCRPDEPVSAAMYMPNLPANVEKKRVLTEEESKIVDAFEQAVLLKKIELEKG